MQLNVGQAVSACRRLVSLSKTPVVWHKDKSQIQYGAAYAVIFSYS